MAKNDPSRPEVARLAQDVGGPQENIDKKLNEGMHHGRGGAGNMLRRDSEREQQVAPGKPERKPSAAAVEGAVDVKKEEKKGRSASKGMLDAAREGINKMRKGSFSAAGEKEK